MNSVVSYCAQKSYPFCFCLSSKTFSAGNIRRFFQSHSNRQGFAVLGFHVNDIDLIRHRYETFHPNLIHHYAEYVYPDKSDGSVVGNDGDAPSVVKILEVFAYYADDGHTADQAHAMNEAKEEKDQHVDDVNVVVGGDSRKVDVGTVLRFVERTSPSVSKSDGFCLPGFIPIEAKFDETSQPAYCDHWVSNVISRTGFLRTLEDTLGFTPKVRACAKESYLRRIVRIFAQNLFRFVPCRWTLMQALLQQGKHKLKVL